MVQEARINLTVGTSYSQQGLLIYTGSKKGDKMKKIHDKLRFSFLVLIGCTSFLFFSGMTSPPKVDAQKSLMDSTSVKINGKNWTFRTPPPPVSQRKVLSSHPRLFITQASLPTLREKLSDPVYASDMNRIRYNANKGYGIENALLYLLEGDASKGTIAKNWLLAGSFKAPAGLQSAGTRVEPVLVFDWVMPLLTSAEKTQIFELVKANYLYDHRIDTTHPRQKATMYGNDVWGRNPELQYPILALAIAGDGIDDVWAQEVLDLAYGESRLAIGPYGATRGGFLDMLASLSLDDGGGWQADAGGNYGASYYTFFLHAFLPLQAWETATGQAMWARTPFYQKLPSYWTYDRGKTQGGIGYAIPEMITGIYRDIDPGAAALARWQVNKLGRSPYLLVYRLILGDLRVTPKSPQELGLPTAKYIRGADLFVSTSSWDENAVTVKATSRYLDTSRYEPASGVFGILRGQEPLAVPGEPVKGIKSAGLYSGLWVYDPTNIEKTRFQRNTFWGHNRVHNAYDAASNPEYFPGGPDNIVINNKFRGISTEYSNQLNAPGVTTARQTIVHILDTNRDFVVAYHYTDVPANLTRAWSMRLAVPPSFQSNGNGFSIPGMTTTVVAPSTNTMTWVGGLGDEMRSPPPERVWYGSKGHGGAVGYSSDPKKAKNWGIGNLFVQPEKTAPQKLEFLVVMDVSDGPPVAVTRISDREAHFGGWKVSFSSDGNFKVIPPDGTIIDSKPPSPPSNLQVQ